jgi:ribonuclease R
MPNNRNSIPRKKNNPPKKNTSIHKTNTTSESPDRYLLHFLKSSDSKTFKREEVLKKMLKKYSIEIAELAINILIEQDKLQEISPNVFKLKASNKGKNVVEGKIDMTKTGGGFLISSQLDRDAFISARNLNTALDGDTVLANITKGNGRPEGEVVEVLKRNKTAFIGTLEVSEKFAFFIANSTKMPLDIFVPLGKTKGATNGSKVLVEMTRYEPGMKSPEGEVVEILSESSNSDLEMKSILIDNGFNITFPPDVIAESEKVSEVITAAEIAKRMDYREICTFTIDPLDAKDFDDALSIRQLANGNWEVGVHIADVSHFVKEGTALDKEAFERSTSVYLPDRVCPMFPEHISNFICSLRPHEEKLCFATIFEFDHKHKVVEYKFGRTIIKSFRRFTYEEAQEVIETKVGDYATEILKLNEIALKLRAEKFKNGAVAFEAPEVKFRLDETGKPVDVYVKERKEAHMLIEDFMLLANKMVAMYVSKLKVKKAQVPMVFRVHDKPDMKKLEVFSETAKRFGYNLKFEDPRQVSYQLNAFFKLISGRPEQNILESLAIRSMAKAVYTTKNIGHYGLAFDYYSHFTSPIRRYPDVMAHRILEECLAEENPPLSADALEERCVHCSNQERAAMTAEREAVKYKQCEYLLEKIGEEFDGIISGVIQGGVFVELKANKCEGFIPVTKLGYDTFVFDEEKVRLVGRTGKQIYQLSDEIAVRVKSVSLSDKRIEFELKDEEV